MLPLGFASFLFFGCVLVLLGASQAGLERDLGLDLTQTGLLAAALAFGLLAGVVGAGPIFDRFARRPLYIGACLTTGLALLAFGPTTRFATAWFLIALVGAGSGAYDTLFNAAIVEKYGARSVKRMSLLHAATTVGAVLCPALVALVAARWHWSRAFHAIGVAHLGLAAVALWVRFPDPPGHAHRESARSVLSPALVPFALVSFAYVGIEGALTIFAVPYSSEGLGLSAVRGQAAISAFWFGLLVGRIAPVFARSPLGGRSLLVAGLVGAVALAGGVAAGSSQIEPLFAATGLALGYVYPVMIARVGLQFPRARGTAAGLTAGAGAIGGFVIPAVMGALGDAAGIRIAAGSLALWCFVLAAGGYGVLRLQSRPADRTTAAA